MIVIVHLFATFRDLAGRESVAVELPIGSTAGDLRTSLAKMFPTLSRLLAHSAIAVNHDYADDSKSIFEGDEVALIPPVSGG